MPNQKLDSIVIGSGQGGTPLARVLAEKGLSVALIEREEVGGTCVNVGCTPTKTMVASARVAYLARRAADYGVGTGAVRVDLQRVRQRKREIVASFRGGSERKLAGLEKLRLVRGEARFAGPRTIVAETSGGPLTLEAERIFLNAGTRPALPALPGLSGTPFLDSTSIMELDSVPERLLVLGGGYVALEFAQMFRRFGSSVTILQHGPQLAAREDPDVSEAIREILAGEGIETHLSTESRSVEYQGERFRLDARTPEGEKSFEGTHLLVAAGRIPNSDRLNLSAAGVETDARGYVRVNERLETTREGIYALGDLKGGPAFTHISYDDFRILRQNLLGPGGASTRDRFVPYTMFTDPQLGRVGMTETQARAAGRKIRVARLPMNRTARGLETDETRGFLKAVVDAGNGRILGCSFLCIDAGEVMAIVQVAMMGGLPYTSLMEATFAHPTLAESLNNLFLTLSD